MSTPPNQPAASGRAGSNREVWQLSYPAILTMISQTVMWTVDAAMVGRLGKVELAAVGLGGLVVWTLYSFFVGLTSSVNTFVAQSYGAKQYQKCGMYLWQGLYVSLLGAALIFVVRAFSSEVLSLLGPDPVVQAESASYVRIRMVSAPFFLIHYTFSHFYRGIGDTKTPLKILALAHAFNIAGDYLLIFGKGPFPQMGVDGAAWATSLANLIAALAFIGIAFRGRVSSVYRLPMQWRFRASETRRLLRIGLPVAVQFFLDMGSFLVFSAYVGRMGVTQLAANQIVIQILALSFMPIQGFAIAATTLMGKYIGAQTPDLALRSGNTAVRLGLYYAGFIAVLCFAVPESLVRVFNQDPSVIALGRPLIILAGVFQLFDAAHLISAGALRGAGDTRVPMLITLSGAWLVFLPLAYLFGSVMERGVTGAWTGATVYVVVLGFAMYARLRSQRWHTIKI